MTLPAMLSTLRAHEARAGAVVVPEWLEYHNGDTKPDRYFEFFRGFYAKSGDGYVVPDDAAELILLGCMAKWLGEQHVFLLKYGETGEWRVMECDDVGGYESALPDATDCLSAHFSACLARLADMPSGGRDQ